MLTNQLLSDAMTQSISKAVSAQNTQPKNYFIFGYKTDGKLITLTPDGFHELGTALDVLSTIDKSWKPFVAVRLTNV